jgi:octaprenyl-diphosphate synthase
MDLLTEIKLPVKEEIEQFDLIFRESLRSDNKLIEAAVDHFLQKKGKNLRPILVLLAAKCSAGIINKNTLDSAVSLELLHNATLLHDDVLDETNLRRGIPTVNDKFSSKLAVLLGDFFLSNTLIKASGTDHLQIIKSISDFSAITVDGEIHQLNSANNVVISEENYFQIIYKKTASLFVTCFRVGALSVDASPEKIEILEKFAHLLGLIFQIRDDIFDYYPSTEVGKPTGNDIREGKITLPLIFALNSCSIADKQTMMSIIDSKNYTSENIDVLIQFSIDNGGIDYAKNKMFVMRDEATDYINRIEESQSRNSLFLILDYIIDRNL